MKFDDARFITQYVRSACIYHGYTILQDGKIIDPKNIVVDDEGIRIVDDNITHVLFVNDADEDEGLYCHKDVWVNRTFVEDRSFVKNVDIKDMIKGLV